MAPSDTPLFTGACFCKAISLRIFALPRSSYLCHCQDCRRFTGSSFAHNLVFPAQSVTLLVSGVEFSIQNDGTTRTSSEPETSSASDTEPGVNHVSEAAAAAAAELSALSTFGNPKEGMVKFCTNCAGRVLITCGVGNGSMDGFVIVPVGVIDDSEVDARLAPKAEFWCRRRESWMLDMKDTKMYTKMT